MGRVGATSESQLSKGHLEIRGYSRSHTATSHEEQALVPETAVPHTEGCLRDGHSLHSSGSGKQNLVTPAEGLHSQVILLILLSVESRHPLSCSEHHSAW